MIGLVRRQAVLVVSIVDDVARALREPRPLDEVAEELLDGIRHFVPRLTRISARRKGDAKGGAVRVLPAARRLTTIAARVLPTVSRPIKAEEFASELYELAAAGGSRRRQLRYAVRVLARIIPLRRALADRARRASKPW